MKEFIRKMYISTVVTLCIIFGFMGFCKTYENIRKIAFGEYQKAIEFKDGTLHFFDYEKEIIKQRE